MTEEELLATLQAEVDLFDRHFPDGDYGKSCVFLEIPDLKTLLRMLEKVAA